MKMHPYEHIFVSGLGGLSLAFVPSILYYTVWVQTVEVVLNEGGN